MHPTEKMTSKVMGAAKDVKAVVEGVTGVFKELMREHGEMMPLLLRVRSSADLDTRRDLYPTIRAELLAHETAELGEVYPVFKQHEDLAGYAEMHEREAGTLKRMIQGLDALPYEEPAWGEGFAELVDAVERHVKEEEGEYFPVASRTLGKAVTQGMTARYQAARTASLDEARQ